MTAAALHVRTADELRSYVHDTLCRRENLVSEQFQLEESALVRHGRCCGLQFLLKGPRNVRLAAVWAAEQQQLYFYDARGERFRKERIDQHVALPTLDR